MIFSTRSNLSSIKEHSETGSRLEGRIYEWSYAYICSKISNHVHDTKQHPIDSTLTSLNNELDLIHVNHSEY